MCGETWLDAAFLDTLLTSRYPSGTKRAWFSGRTSPCQGEGRGFESHRPLQEAVSLQPSAISQVACADVWLMS